MKYFMLIMMFIPHLAFSGVVVLGEKKFNTHREYTVKCTYHLGDSETILGAKFNIEKDIRKTIANYLGSHVENTTNIHNGVADISTTITSLSISKYQYLEEQNMNNIYTSKVIVTLNEELFKVYLNKYTITEKFVEDHLIDYSDKIYNQALRHQLDKEEQDRAQQEKIALSNSILYNNFMSSLKLKSVEVLSTERKKIHTRDPRLGPKVISKYMDYLSYHDEDTYTALSGVTVTTYTIDEKFYKWFSSLYPVKGFLSGILISSDRSSTALYKTIGGTSIYCTKSYNIEASKYVEVKFDRGTVALNNCAEIQIESYFDDIEYENYIKVRNISLINNNNTRYSVPDI